jgi:hypothetical protein
VASDLSHVSALDDAIVNQKSGSVRTSLRTILDTGITWLARFFAGGLNPRFFAHTGPIARLPTNNAAPFSSLPQ